MRRIAPAAALLLAACATAPPAPVATVAPAITADRHDHRTLNGMTAADLIAHFGKPRLQVIEGVGTKLQFAGPACILDTYLYPSGSGMPRVTDIEARNFQGDAVNTQECVYAVEQHKAS
jgi:hypothetical protein